MTGMHRPAYPDGPKAPVLPTFLVSVVCWTPHALAVRRDQHVKKIYEFNYGIRQVSFSTVLDGIDVITVPGRT